MSRVGIAAPPGSSVRLRLLRALGFRLSRARSAGWTGALKILPESTTGDSDFRERRPDATTWDVQQPVRGPCHAGTHERPPLSTTTRQREGKPVPLDAKAVWMGKNPGR